MKKFRILLSKHIFSWKKRGIVISKAKPRAKHLASEVKAWFESVENNDGIELAEKYPCYNGSAQG